MVCIKALGSLVPKLVLDGGVVKLVFGNGSVMNVLRVFMACLTLLTGVGCRDTGAAPEQEQTQARVMSTQEADRIEQWVERMDPYVTQNADGTFSIDYASFQQRYTNLTPEDQAVVIGLRDGIPIMNESILRGRDDSIEWAACWSWWWGTKCCYTGNQAETIIYVATVAGVISAAYTLGLGVVVGIAAATLNYFKNISGGFCFYRYTFHPNAIAVTPLR